MEIKVGDLVKLRDDLEDGIKYGTDCFNKGMRFEGFKRVDEVLIDGSFLLNIIESYYYSPEMLTEVKRPCQYKTIYKREEILNKEEREYLRTVVKPFRNDIRCISKESELGDESEYIVIHIYSDDNIVFPSFKTGTRYKDMDLCKEYSLEELGL